MGPESVFDKIRHFFAGLFFSLYLWSMKMTKEQFWDQQDRDALRKFKAEGNDIPYLKYSGERLYRVVRASIPNLEWAAKHGPGSILLDMARNSMDAWEDIFGKVE